MLTTHEAAEVLECDRSHVGGILQKHGVVAMDRAWVASDHFRMTQIERVFYSAAAVYGIAVYREMERAKQEEAHESAV